MWLKTMLPVPAPNVTVGVFNVPGPAATWPSPAPMLTVPVEPA
ncbi:hypothetical protein QIH80_28410 [Bradyrhizobium elkanii]|nr:hypothetical protein QIH80_28410 [Bradyrhizobium elkanii]